MPRLLPRAPQHRTRRRLAHLLMADNPTPLGVRVTVLQSDVPPVEARLTLANRDDGDPALAPPPGGHPVAIAVNGHGGSAHALTLPDNDFYWYGDAFARHGFVVLALDISHRPVADRAGRCTGSAIAPREGGTLISCTS